MTQADSSSIAIVGVAGRFPDAPNLDAFWENLRAGRESIRDLTPDELTRYGITYPHRSDADYVWRAAPLENMECFDATFFGMTPSEARSIDPQHRLLLETAWHAMESAGYDGDSFPGLVGVYCGTSFSYYLLENLIPTGQFTSSAMGVLMGVTGSYPDYAPTRVAFKLNLRGPAIAVQTACSTALVSLHLARQALLNYECDMALAGGVSGRSPQLAGYVPLAGMTSSDGRCRVFDTRADGTVFGTGCGIVVLKRLEDALSDRDHIWGIVRGSAVNNDGSAKAGFTAPGVRGQSEAIMEALANAEVDSESIDYVEAHGTGTVLGDPIEVEALSRAFSAGTDRKGFCGIGSVKSNVGHVEAAAGVCALIKTLLALEHEEIPPTLHCERPNPRIDFASTPFYVNTSLRPWPRGERPRRASVSAFGIGGTNAHVVIEEAPHASTQPSLRSKQLLLLSAKSAKALDALTEDLAGHLRRHPELALPDVAYTLQIGRRTFNHRRFLVCSSLEDATAALQPRDPERLLGSVGEHRDRRVVFMFSGQGSQYIDMGAELYEVEPVFRRHLDECARGLRDYLGLELREVLYPGENAEEATRELGETWLTQPALFAIEYALAQLWMSWGVRPSAMIGHSTGELVAACLAGVLDIQDALRVVAARGRLMQSCPPGTMLSISLGEEEVRAQLDDDLCIAALNAPALTVVAGTESAIEQLEQRMAARAIETKRLRTTRAFHSHLMEPALESFEKILREVKLHAPRIPFVSNVTGTWITSEQAIDPHYWTSHIREAVQFVRGLDTLSDDAEAVLLEVGPGTTLATLARQHSAVAGVRPVLASLPHPKSPEEDCDFLTNTVGRLWLAGVAIDWKGFHAEEARRRVPLPGYAFERVRHVIEPTGDDLRLVARAVPEAEASDAHPLLGPRVASMPPMIQFERRVHSRRASYLQDHRLFGELSVPGAAYVELALAALAMHLGEPPQCLEDMSFRRMMLLGDHQERNLQVSLSPIDSSRFECRIFSRRNDDASGDGFTLHAGGIVLAKGKQAPKEARTDEPMEAIRARCEQEVKPDDFYRFMEAAGLEYGPSLRCVTDLRRRDGEAFGAIDLPEAAAAELENHRLHPAILDALTHVAAAALPTALALSSSSPLIPVGFDRLTLHAPIGTRSRAHARFRLVRQSPTGGEEYLSDAVLTDETGRVLIELEGFRQERQELADLREEAGRVRLARVNDWLYEISWLARPIDESAAASLAGEWLVVGEDDSFARAVAWRLQEAGATSRILDTAAIEALLGSGRLDVAFAGVVTLQGLQDAWDAELTTELVAGAQSRGPLALVRLLQALLGRGGTAPRLCVVTRAAVAVDDAAGAAPGQAALWSMGQVIRLEHPELGCISLDLDPRATEADADAVLAELRSASSELQVAWRAGTRYVPRLVPAAPQKEEDSASFPVDPDGTYLITGGFGGLGQHVAHWLVAQGARHLVLMSRSAPNDAMQHAIAALERGGACVEVATVNAADAAAVRAVVDGIAERGHVLKGVIHSAGVLDDVRLLALDGERWQRVAESKIAGATNLHLATRELPLDFFVLFSSAASIFGNWGQSNYAAANGFLDGLAHYRRGLGLKGLSINWGAWAGPGMAKALLERSERSAQPRLDLIHPDQGLEAFRRLLGRGARQATFLAAEPRRLAGIYRAFGELPALMRGLHGDGDDFAVVQHPRPDLAVEFVAPTDDVEERIAKLWQLILGFDRVGVLDNFFELGGSSLLGIQLVSRISAEFRTTIQPTDLFEAPTVRGLARLVRGDATPDLTVSEGSERGQRRRERRQQRRADSGNADV